MPETLALCTPAQVKQQLRMTPAQIAAGGQQPPAGVTSVDDALIEILCDAVSDGFAGACGRNFGESEYTEKRNGTGTSGLMLFNTPVTEIVSLSLTGPRSSANASDASTALVENVDFTWDTRGFIQLYSATFPKGIANVVAVYLAGFAAVPSDLSRAAARWCTQRYKELDRIGQRSKSVGGETVNFDISDCSPDVKAVVDRYTLRSSISANSVLGDL